MKSRLIFFGYWLLVKIIGLFINDPIEFLCPFVSAPRFILDVAGVSIGKNVRIGRGLVVHNFNPNNLSIASDVHIGKKVFLDTSDSISLEKRSTLSMQVTILTHMNVGSSKLSKIYPPIKSPLTIKKDAYVGAHTTILDKTTIIGEGVIVGANSLVNKDLTDYKVYAGNPVRAKKNITIPKISDK